MAKTLKLKITADVIKGATAENSAKCMIAQAVRLAGGRSTHVTAESVSFNMGDKRYTYPLPAKAAVELIKFDTDKKSVKPFVVTLAGHTGFVRDVVKRGPKKKKKTQSKKGKKFDVTKVLKGARKGGPTGTHPTGKAKRGVRRFHGLRVIEA